MQPSYIFQRVKAKDKKDGFAFDHTLMVEQIAELIERGCSYCGATKRDIAIGLDRKDNTIGHTLKNVVPACARCNLVRGTMPFEAWLVIAPEMKKARELGLFGDWIPGPKKRNQFLATHGGSRR